MCLRSAGNNQIHFALGLITRLREGLTQEQQRYIQIHADVRLKQAMKMVGGEAGNSGQYVQRELLGEMPIDVSHNPRQSYLMIPDRFVLHGVVLAQQVRPRFSNLAKKAVLERKKKRCIRSISGGICDIMKITG